jgi:hypothetical protein
MLAIQGLRRLRQEDHEFKANLMPRPISNTQKREKEIQAFLFYIQE